MRFLTFTLLFFAATTFAQLPDTQRAWSDGAISGAELLVWLAENPAKPEARKPVRFRLAGVQCPESIGGGITQQLTDASTHTLSYLTSGQELELQTIAVERVYVWVGNGYALVNRYVGFVRVEGTYSPQKPFQRQWEDCGAILLRVGWVKLNRISGIELTGYDDLLNRYTELEREAKNAQRGLWRYAWLFPPQPIDREPSPAPRLPIRK